MAAADHALYAAKNSGKNRHAVYDPPATEASIAAEAMPEQRTRVLNFSSH